MLNFIKDMQINEDHNNVEYEEELDRLVKLFKEFSYFLTIFLRKWCVGNKRVVVNDIIRSLEPESNEDKTYSKVILQWIISKV